MSGKPLSQDYLTGTRCDGTVKYAFIGEHNDDELPDGFIRMIDEEGNIFEGVFTPDGKRNGFCVKFSSLTKKYYIGFYQDDKK